MAEELLFEKSNKIATITLNRPDKLNVFHDGMLADWAAALRDCQADDDINVVILTAVGRAFCAGGDISRMADQSMGEYLRTNVHPVARAVEALQKPYIAALNSDRWQVFQYRYDTRRLRGVVLPLCIRRQTRKP